ncbi:MAG TPA: Ig-like domain-containing protein [Thermoanaerobaculia bacterium]|nr:Ig-like domain-containing protein [Thermoanaerobaculia bacterium]
MRRFSFSALLVLLLLASPVLAEEYDDCDANFIAFIGSSAYQFSPAHEGDLGAVRLFTILSYQRAAHEKRFGYAIWQLRIDRASDGERVFTVDGRSYIGAEGAAVAELFWDGRDERGALVSAGRYHYTWVARYLGGAGRMRPVPDAYDAVFDDYDEAAASTDDVIVDYDLEPVTAHRLRISANATSCQVQQNAPLEAGFAYNFYYGSTHAHSNWSDGGQPTTSCSSGNAYGSGTFPPSSVYNFAKVEAGLDFWVINEHNHLIENAIDTNNPPVTEAKVRQRYQDGLAAANSATVNGDFVALYGMEWGVTTNSDQGHVTLIETPALFGWETCSTCNGPGAECTPGTDCYFDVFTPKRFGYLTLYARSVANPSSAGALGIFNHPSSGHFDGFAFNADADNAIQGVAVRSGLAFSTANDCANTNVGATDYSARWKQALNIGFHAGPVADHDSHCNNYGVAIPTRTVYIAPSLTKADLMAAHRARHFFASEDPNAQLVFRTNDGAHIMGDIFTAAGGATLVANLYDPDGESISTLEIWRGQIGAGVPTSPHASFSNQSSATITESLTSGTYYYYVHAVQADGHDLWSAPMWITYESGGGGGDTTPPTTSITAPSNGATVSGTTLVTASASDDVGVTRVDFLLDGAVQASDSTAPYEWSWSTTTATDGTHALVSKAYDAASNEGTSATVSVTVSNGGGGGGSSADVSGWKVTQANATWEYTIPAATTIPADGYLIIARDATKTAFETFWGVTLGANVTYLSSAGVMPQINGDENYTLRNASAVVVDGPTPSMSASAGQSVQRVDPCGTTWNALASTSGNPGSGAGAGCGGGVKINEFSDAAGTGNFIYEFVELHNDSASSGGDTTAPTTSITAPLDGAVVAGTTIVTASASDDVGVTQVEFYLDNVLQSTDTTSPYEWSWNTTTAANGAHALVSKAYDAANNAGTSSTVNVTVDNDLTPPTTSITAPANGATVSGAVNVTASASDNVGVTRVEFFLDNVLQSTDTTSPYEWSWSTTTATNGTHSLVSKAYDAASNVGTSSAVSVTVDNDTTPPTTSITAPANGATVSGTVNVTASASDNVGVTRVEFFLDNVLQSTDTTSPYEWSWSTTTATNDTHSLVSKAYDAANNVGTSSTVGVTVSNGTPIDISGYRIVQANASLTYFIPSGTTIPSRGYVIVGRNATKAQFETFWGVTLGSNVIYINSGDTMPQINGSETYDLRNASNQRVDGTTIAMASSGGESIRRVNGCGNANKSSSWSRNASSTANPGSGAPSPCGKGVFISEFSDALGTGNYIYEFVELANDK